MPPPAPNCSSWQEQIPAFSAAVFKGAPHLDMQVSHQFQAFQEDDNGPNQKQKRGARNTDSTAEALADELPTWLLDTLQIKERPVHKLFTVWRLAGRNVITKAEFSGSLHKACGIELSEDELAELQRIVRLKSEPSTDRVSTTTDTFDDSLMDGFIDVRLLGRAFLCYESRLRLHWSHSPTRHMDFS